MVEEEMLGKDIMLSSDFDIMMTSNNDFRIASGIVNIEQAIYNRLITQRGFFKDFPLYGGFLFRALGKPNIESTRLYIRKVVYETLLQEPRISNIEKVEVARKSEREIKISIEVQLLEEVNPYNFVYDFFI